MTSIKSLCQDSDPAQAFALFLAVCACRQIEEKAVPARYKEQMDRGIAGMHSFLANPEPERQLELSALLGQIAREQDEFRNIPWTQIRTIHSMKLLVVAKALKSILRPWEAPFWLYQAAKDSTEKYDPRYGTGLIPSSAPMMQEIADFWRDYFDLEP